MFGFFCRRPCAVPEVGMTEVYYGDLSRISTVRKFDFSGVILTPYYNSLRLDCSRLTCMDSILALCSFSSLNCSGLRPTVALLNLD